MPASAELLTLEQFMARSEREDGQREELLEGELIVSPAPKMPHAAIVERVRDCLASLRPSFAVINDFACVLGTHSMPAPDLAVLRRERLVEAVRQNAWLEGSPELVIEVSSPSNRRATLVRKAAAYLEHGAEQVWVIYPKTRTVSVFTVERTSEARPGESLEFHGLSFAVDEIFAEP